jgi:hypothetical protein
MNALFDDDLSNVGLEEADEELADAVGINHAAERRGPASATTGNWTTRQRIAQVARMCSVLEVSRSGCSRWLVVDTMAGRVHVRCDETAAPPVFSAPRQLLLLG